MKTLRRIIAQEMAYGGPGDVTDRLERRLGDYARALAINCMRDADASACEALRNFVVNFCQTTEDVIPMASTRDSA